jgi:hypothetical protein
MTTELSRSHIQLTVLIENYCKLYRFLIVISEIRFILGLSCNADKGEGKADPLQAWSGPEVFRKLSFPDFMTTAQDGGKVVSHTHRPTLSPGNTPGTHFC